MTTAPLFRLDPLPDGPVVVLDGPEGHHAAAVRRLGVGEAVTVGDGRGRVRRAVVRETGRDRLVLHCDPVQVVPPPRPRLVVVQALAKGDRGELAVELMTEFGVDEIAPWAAARCVTRWQGDRGERSRQRWARTADEAAKQSRRAWTPAVTPLASTAQVAARLPDAAAAIVLHESAGRPVDPLPDDGDICLVVGPEGGITDAELAAFAAVGAVPARLGEPVLRTSSAGAAGLAALSVRLGRWS